MPKQPLKWIVTGNFTADGAVGYLTSKRDFSRNLSDALVFEVKDAAEDARLECARNESVITDPYTLEVTDSEREPDVLTARERIRSQGPTTPYGHAASKPSAV